MEPVSKKGFPLINLFGFIDCSSKRLLAQQTDKLGITLPIAPGAYDVIGTTTYDQHVEIASKLAVNAGQITRLDTLAQVAAISVHAPNVKGLDMKAVYAYALKAGTNQIAAKVEAWDGNVSVSLIVFLPSLWWNAWRVSRTHDRIRADDAGRVWRPFATSQV